MKPIASNGRNQTLGPHPESLTENKAGDSGPVVIPLCLRFDEGHNMAWTKTTRKIYRRKELRYASDTTAKEWILLSPLLPKPSRVGRPREVDLRTIMDAIL